MWCARGISVLAAKLGSILHLYNSDDGRTRSAKWKSNGDTIPIGFGGKPERIWGVPLAQREPSEVTGIRQNGPEATAEFKWRWKLLPPFDNESRFEQAILMQWNVTSGDHSGGISAFALYDDGWRIRQ
jgi:hypothetical protein